MFVLVPGAGGDPWLWHRVVPELRSRGHAAVAVDLPGPDESAGLPEYAEAIAAAIGDAAADAVVVAQSLAGFCAVMTCARTPVRELVLLNAMIPLPGETPARWWGNTGSADERVAAARAGGYSPDFDVETYFLHDVPAEILATGGPGRPEAAVVFQQPCTIDQWPDVPTRVLVGREDRFLPAAFQRRLARERLGIDAEELPGGHLLALSQPVALSASLARGHDPS